MINKILLAVDGSENAQRATDIAAELASKLNADLFIMHVEMHGRPPEELMHMAEVEHLVKEAYSVVSPNLSYVMGSYIELLGGDNTDPRYERGISIRGQQRVERANARCAKKGVKTINTVVRSGDYAEEILKAAKEFKVDMIVIGSRGLGLLKSTLLGSVSQYVLNHTDCSVVTVR